MPFISLDRLHWGPGWTSASPEELKAKVGATLDEAGGGWVADGDYRSKLGNFVLDKTTDVVCK